MVRHGVSRRTLAVAVRHYRLAPQVLPRRYCRNFLTPAARRWGSAVRSRRVGRCGAAYGHARARLAFLAVHADYHRAAFRRRAVRVRNLFVVPQKPLRRRYRLHRRRPAARARRNAAARARRQIILRYRLYSFPGCPVRAFFRIFFPCRIAFRRLARCTLRGNANPRAAVMCHLLVVVIRRTALPVATVNLLRELHTAAHPAKKVASERHLPRRQYEQTLLRRKLVAHHARVSLNARRVLTARREDNQRRAVLVPLVAAQTETHLNYLVPRRRLAVRNARVVIRLRKHHVVLANRRHQTPVILALHAFIRALGNIKFLAPRLVARFPEILHLVPLVARETALPAARHFLDLRNLITGLAQHYVAAHVAQLPYLEL